MRAAATVSKLVAFSLSYSDTLFLPNILHSTRQQKDDDVKVTVPMETDCWRGTLHGFIKDDVSLLASVSRAFASTNTAF